MLVWVTKVEYLGHFIFIEGASTDLDKIAFYTGGAPTIDCQTTQGLPHSHRILSKVHPLVWRHQPALDGVIAMEALDCLKQAMLVTLVLTLPDFTQRFNMETNASGSRIGVILTQ